MSWPPIPALAGDNRSRQVAGYYRKLIVDGHVGEHEQLPSHEEIARLWDTSVSTAARGIALLRQEGLVYSSTLGVFVAATSPREPQHIPLGAGMYLAHMDTEKLDRAEQAASFLDSLGNFWPNDTRVQIAQLLSELRQARADRKPAWNPGAAATSLSAVDCKWPRCKDANGGCADGYPCTAQNDRVAREIEDPTPVPVN